MFLIDALIRASPSGTALHTTIALDNGASRTFIHEGLATSLGIQMVVEWSEVSVLGGASKDRSAIISFQLSGDGKSWIDVPFASTRRNLTVKGPKVRWGVWAESHPKFRGLNLKDVDYGNIGVLLGGVDYKRITGPPRDFVDSDCGRFSAMLTRLGWTISGPIAGEVGRKAALVAQVVSKANKEVEEESEVLKHLVSEFKRFNEVESLGIVKDPNPKLSLVEKVEYQYLSDNVTEIEGRFEVPMLKSFSTSMVQKLPESETSARRRLWSTHRKLARTPGAVEEYQRGIDADLKKGYIRKLPAEELDVMKSGPHMFLPHFGVRHPDKPEKLRRVLDAAAKCHGKSLNDLLKRGPNILESLPGVLSRWRVGRYAVNADIAEMFSQIRMTVQDQYLTAFLWSCQADEEPEVYVNTRHVFGAKCSPAIAAFCVEEALRRKVPDSDTRLKRSFYMDDHFSSWDDLESLRMNTSRLTSGLEDAGFVLSKWQSNCGKFLEGLGPEALGAKFKDLGPDSSPLPSTKALGILWDCDEDSLGFSSRYSDKPVKTIADVLSCLASCFDPLGYVSPFLFVGKLLMQQFWQDKTSWEEALSEEETELWHQFTLEIPVVKKLKVPRWLGTQFGEEVDLHVFSDASSTGLGAVAYVKAAGKPALLLGAKSRIQNPRKAPTIPKLELQGIVLAARLADTFVSELSENLRIRKVHLWTDSEVAFWWVKNEEKRYEVYVANRVFEIRNFLNRDDLDVELRHVPTDMNPADLVSRGLTAEELERQWEFWLRGPDFLKDERQKWPKSPKKKKCTEGLEPPAPVALTTVTEWEDCKRACNKAAFLVKRLREEEGNDSKQSYSMQAIEAKEVEILHEIQRERFPKVFRFLEKQQGKTGVYWGTELRGKELFIDGDGLLRLRTRLGNADFCHYDEKYPVILPRKHPFTEMIIRCAHVDAGHCGTKLTRSYLARRYFVPKPQQSVGSVCTNCVDCIKKRPKPTVVEIGDLHRNRLKKGSYAFANVGMDHWGPFELKSGKRWGLLVMCLTTRAVWLELCPDPDALSLQNCLIQFACENGNPEVLYSDNGGAMVGTASDFGKMLEKNRKRLSEYLTHWWNAEFRFIPPGSPHWGGSWESMIKEIKRILKMISENLKTVDDFHYRTLLKRIQHILNNRPLEIGDDGEVLTPWHFLRPSAKRSGGIPLELSNHQILERLGRAERFFWDRWHTSYLRFLSPNHTTREGRRVDLKVGDQVLVKELKGGTFSPYYEPGTIVEVFPGSDGLVRNTRVKTKLGTFTRASNRLCLAEGPALERFRQSLRTTRDRPGTQSVEPPTLQTV